MPTMDKKQILILGAVVIVVIIVAVVWGVVGNQHNGTGVAGPGAAPVGPASSPPSATYQPTVPANVVVPDMGASSSAPAGVAVPQTQSAAAPGVSSKYRSFDITLDATRSRRRRLR